MKIMAMAMLLMLAGCAGSPTMEQLEDEAIVSGDWTAVERRELMIQRKNQRIGPECSNGYRSVCVEQGLTVKCGCVRPLPGRMNSASAQ